VTCSARAFAAMMNICSVTRVASVANTAMPMAGNGALDEYNKAKADFYIEKAERLRAELLAMKGNLKNRAAKK
jgi:hypothetical protein